MLKFRAEILLSAHHEMTQLGYLANEFRAGKVDSIPPEAVTAILVSIDKLVLLLDDLDLPLSVKSARDLRAYFNANRTPPALGLAGDLARRIHDELALRCCIVLSPREGALFEQIGPIFGSAVEAAFPLASEDISEAAKCMGLGRYTAAIFHLMRAMELTVIRLGVKLNVAVVDANNLGLDWGKILGNVKIPIEKMPKGIQKDGWAEAFSLLVHVKTAWRNPTMHPKQTYTEEQARDIFAATRAFMRSLAALV
jgi:hypothetical protein